MCNAERAKEGKAPLTWSDELHKISYDWSVEQSAAGWISHDKFEENYQAAIAAGLKIGYFAENVAYNFAGSWSDAMRTVVNQWMNSPGHRGNIMGDHFKIMAVGTYYNEAKGQYFFTQLFG